MKKTRKNRGWTIIILMFAIALQTQAQKLINLKLDNKPLPVALKLIEREGGKNIIFSVTETENYSVTASIRQKTQTEAINIVLQSTPFISKERADYFVIQKKDTQTKSIEIRGIVMNEKNEPMPYCNVLLLSSDSTFVNGCVTKNDGSFLMVGEKNVPYLIKASYIGYTTMIQKVHKQNTILLSPNNHLLEDVVVTGKNKQPLIVQQAGKLVFNVENCISAQGANAFEILKYTPGVMINEGSKTISINGLQNILVMLNGKQTYMQPTEVVDLLKSTPSSNVKSIEVMTNATAQYDASGSGGILNIVLKKERGSGYNMTVNTGIAYWFNVKQNTEISFNYNHNRINVYGNYGHNLGYVDMFYGGKRKQSGKLFDAHSKDTDKRNTVSASLGLNYAIASNHQVGIQTSGNFLFGPGDIHTINHVYDSYEKNNLLYILHSKSDYYHQTANRYHFNAYYKFELPEDKMLTFDFDYSLFRGNSRINQPNVYYSPTNDIDSTLSYRNIGKRNIHLYALTSNYKQTLGKGEFSTGIKYSNVKSKNFFTLYDKTDGEGAANLVLSNDFHYQESILAAYLMYDFKLANKWKFNIGTRMEYTHSHGHLYPLPGNLQEEKRISKDYVDFFPSASITYQIDDNNTLSLSYGKRIDRPVYADLNPIEQPLDGLSSWKGNPFLEAQKTHRFSLQYQYKRTSMELSYSNTSDYFVSITDTLGTNKTVVTPLNLGRQEYYGMSLSQSLRLFKAMDVYFSGRVYYLDNQLAFDKNRCYNRSRWAYGLMLQTSFPLFWGIKSEILGIYASKRLGGSTEMLGANYQINVGLQKTFLNNRAIVKLSMSDIFWTSNWDNINKFTGFESINYGHSESRLVRLNLTFKFGGNKNNYSKKSKVEMEMNRF